jgi:hypothetical protein
MYDPIERDGMDEDAIGSEMEIHGGKYHGGEGVLVSFTRCRAWLRIIASREPEEDEPFVPFPELVHVFRSSLMHSSAPKKELLKKGDRVHLVRTYAGLYGSIIRLTPKMVVVKLDYDRGELIVLKTSVTVMDKDDERYPVPTGPPRQWKFVYPLRKRNGKYERKVVYYKPRHVPRVNYRPFKELDDVPEYEGPSLVEDLVIVR